MKNKKVIAIVVLVVGIVLLGLSLAADAIGIGGGGGFGPRQIAGSVVGVIAVIVGLFLMLKK